MVERKVAQMVDIFNIAIGWKLLFPLVVQQFVLAYASRTHINARSPDIFSIRDIAQCANRIRKSFPSFFVACWVYIYIYIYSCRLYSFFCLLYFSPWLYFLMRKCFLLPRVIASSIRAVGSIILLYNFLNRFALFIILYLLFVTFDDTVKHNCSTFNNIFNFNIYKFKDYAYKK